MVLNVITRMIIIVYVVDICIGDPRVGLMFKVSNDGNDADDRWQDYRLPNEDCGYCVCSFHAGENYDEFGNGKS